MVIRFLALILLVFIPVGCAISWVNEVIRYDIPQMLRNRKRRPLTEIIKCHIARHYDADLSYGAMLFLGLGLGLEYGSALLGVAIAAMGASFHARGAFVRHSPFIICLTVVLAVASAPHMYFITFVMTYAAGFVVTGELICRFDPAAKKDGPEMIIILWPYLYLKVFFVVLAVGISASCCRISTSFSNWRRQQLCKCSS
ncbi:MAG: hypothetical protein P4L53_03995 [Candidatus Obscuribacterales bacterium]|nr:hypothetical protein [Candidatus Obscuribacterales bacterium]